jgi:hypothetical protein
MNLNQEVTTGTFLHSGNVSAEQFIWETAGFYRVASFLEVGACGFGAGSDLTWQLQTYAGYRFPKIFQLTAGYRILSINYDKGTGAEQFINKVDTFGPVIRMGFNF